MNDILQSLMEQHGVHVAMVLNGDGRIEAHRQASIYDDALLGAVAAHVVRTVESVELVHPGWESMQAQFQDGTLLLRALQRSMAGARRRLLTVVADPSLNASFAVVAMRVVAQKLEAALSAVSAGPATSAPQLHASSLAPLGPSSAPTPLPPPLPDPRAGSGSAMGSGLYWSGLSGSGFRLEVADEQASARLGTLTRILARYVGPMAKVFVKEVALEVCQGEPFQSHSATPVARAVAQRIPSPEDRETFLHRIAQLESDGWIG